MFSNFQQWSAMPNNAQLWPAMLSNHQQCSILLRNPQQLPIIFKNVQLGIFWKKINPNFFSASFFCDDDWSYLYNSKFIPCQLSKPIWTNWKSTFNQGNFMHSNFWNICNFFITLEILLTWYIIEKVLKSKPEMEEVGMAECFTFFTVVISIGLTLISISVGPYFHNYLLKYNGLPFNVFNRLHPK